jgi:hypothetical protein
MSAPYRLSVADANLSAVGKTHGLTLTVVSLLSPLAGAGLTPSELEVAVGNVLRANFQFVRGPVKDPQRLAWESTGNRWSFRTRRLIHYQIKQNEQAVLITLEVEGEPEATADAPQ